MLRLGHKPGLVRVCIGWGYGDAVPALRSPLPMAEGLSGWEPRDAWAGGPHDISNF